MRIALALLLIVHGVAHGVGFAVPWGLLPSDEPVDTTLLGGRLDLGEAGSRAYGVLWLAVGVLFAAVGLQALFGRGAWPTWSVGLALLSGVMCLLSLPVTLVGLLANAAVLVAVWVWKNNGY
ncbi:MAG: hypothetical protein R3E10_08590 [Gemmatimonadota bacterium]